jgi:hypothetical protein
MAGLMRIPRALAILSALSAAVQPAAAQLPGISHQPWLGYFAVSESRQCRLGITSQGQIKLQLEPSTGAPGIGLSSMNIVASIEEVTPDGKTTVRKLNVSSLESEDSPTDKLEKTVIRGKVTGNAVFELTIEQVRGNFIISNRLLDSGAVTKNTIRPIVALHVPVIYQYSKGELSKPLQKQRAKDSLHLRWTDGNRKRFALVDEVDASSGEFNGPGIASAQIEAGGLIRDRKLILEVTDGESSMTAQNTKLQPLNAGLRFTARPASGDTARLTLTIR